MVGRQSCIQTWWFSFSACGIGQYVRVSFLQLHPEHVLTVHAVAQALSPAMEFMTSRLGQPTELALSEGPGEGSLVDWLQAFRVIQVSPPQLLSSEAFHITAPSCQDMADAALLQVRYIELLENGSSPQVL